MTRECGKTLIPLNIFGWCRCFAILGQNETYILCFLALPPPCPKTVSAPLRKLIDVTNKFFIMNVISTKQKFSANLIYLSFSKFSYRQSFEAGISAQIRLKARNFYWKIVKITQSWGSIPIPPMPPTAGGYAPRHPTQPSFVTDIDYLYCKL